jgi:FlaA1/EpsC-like NDP-sugar epimerase
MVFPMIPGPVPLRRAAVLALHAAAFAASLLGSFLLRFDGSLDPFMTHQLAVAMPVFILTKLAVFFALRQHTGWWRYASFSDLQSLFKATLIAAAATAVACFALDIRTLPRSIFPLDAIMTIALLGGARFGLRYLRESFLQQGPPEAGVLRTLVVGTGTVAEGLLRDVRRGAVRTIDIVGVIDLDPRHKGSLINGYAVAGGLADLARVAQETGAKQVIIALDGGSKDAVRRVIDTCNTIDLAHRVLPATDDLVHGSVTISHLREVSLQDILGRSPVRLDSEQLERLFTSNTVLVTGAGGSIGSELCRQVARFGPSQIIMLEQAENPLFHLERELRASHPDIDLEAVVADIGDYQRLEQVCLHFRPRVVLHAAAHKHVPLMEKNPWEAIKNNILGTHNLIRSAQAAGVDVVVLISTDKAVNPTSVMGATKRVSEMLMQSLSATSQTRLTAVRFGNVLGSNGSVIPIFKEQIAAGGPVTVTHPEMKRYFMTIPEASQLVLQAATFAEGGDVFVLDMGEPVLIVDVARDLIRLSGLEPDRDIKIEFSGIRPGEKLFEELSTAGEGTAPTPHARIFRFSQKPPDDKVVLEAIRLLENCAATDQPPSHIRATLFAILDAIERNASIAELAAAARDRTLTPSKPRTAVT